MDRGADAWVANTKPPFEQGLRAEGADQRDVHRGGDDPPDTEADGEERVNLTKQALRRWLRSRGIKSTIPSYLRRERKRPKRGRSVQVGPGYAERWKVERTFAWLGNFRRLLVRHERYLFTFRA